jgi:hypothetical protein
MCESVVDMLLNVSGSVWSEGIEMKMQVVDGKWGSKKLRC